MIREQLKSAQIEAMKAGDKERLAAVRLILAKLKDRDIELRTASSVPDDDSVVVEVLQKMVKQRRESIEMFRNGGREELAAKEQAELDVIDGLLPAQLGEDETRAAIEARKAEVGAESAVIDLPHPDGPIITRNSPSRTSIDTPFSARTPLG